jgi:hypothetical protein
MLLAWAAFLTAATAFVTTVGEETVRVIEAAQKSGLLS